MGAWGLGLFQSDSDLDMLCDLGADMELDLYFPEDREHVRKELDEGKFSTKFAELRTTKPTRGSFYDPKYLLILLTAAGMELGVTITDDQRGYVKKVVERVHMYPEAHDDMVRALAEYKSGSPYAIAGPGLIDTMMAATSDREPESGPVLINTGLLPIFKQPGQL
jgi:hypothetical protein